MKIVKNRKIYFAVSIIIMIIGAAFAVINAGTGNGVLNFDVQFVGGTSIEANIGQEFDNDELADLIKDVTGDQSVSVQKTGDGTSVIVKTKYLSDTITDRGEEEAAAETETAAVLDEKEAVIGDEATEEISEDVDTEELNVESSNEEAVIDDEATEEASEDIDTGELNDEGLEEEADSNAKSAIVNALVDKYGITDPDNNISINEVSATISTEMWQTALLAVLVACIAMLIYITIRFRDFKTGASVVVALIHDVLIVLAFYAIVRVPVNSTFIAAILTVLGYSVNASIVIFDRIRENRGKSLSRSKEETVDLSVQQSITRSIFTSLTTLFTIAALYVMGVQSVKEFALPIIVGIVCGTYSSVFLAGSLWYTISEKKKKSV